MDFEAAGLLDGLESEERSARERLLEQLAKDGYSLDELKIAVAENRLPLLPVQRVLGARYTAHDIEQRTGLPARMLLRIRRLAGLSEAGPDDRVFGEEDIPLGEATKLFLDAGLGEDAIVEITRVLGEGMSRAAAATTAVFADAFLQPGDSEQDVALRFAELAEKLLPAVTPVLVATFKAHLRESVQRGILGREQLEAGQIVDAQMLAVCFADLVGFTRLGGEVEVRELGTVAGTLARLAAEVSTQPVRLVKTIGDAALYVSIEPAPLVEVALSLIEAVDAADLPSLRAGIAYGPALQRAGDYYGHSVNLASRVTGIARPGSVLCTKEVRDSAPEAFEWSFAGRHRLKGLPHAVPLYRARRQAEADAEPATRRRADRPRRRASNSAGS